MKPQNSIFYLFNYFVIGVYYFDANGIFVYLFDASSGKLTKVRGFVHNVSLNLYYSEHGLLQTIQHSASGKRLSVNYTRFDRIGSIELLSDDNTVEKTK